VEEVLAGLWAEVLGLEELGIDDGFFALGGDSLAATRLVARVQEVLGVDLALDAVLENPTVADLAALLEARKESAPEPPPVPLGEGPAPLTFAQRRLWFLHQLDPLNPVHNFAARVGLAGELDAAALGQALAEIRRRHGALRTRFLEGEGEPVQVLAKAGPEVLPCLDLVGVPAHRRDAVARALAVDLARRPFALDAGHLLRAALLRLGPREHALVLVFHHIAADGGSLRLFLDELSTLYDAFRRHRPSPLPEPALQVPDIAAWQRGRGEHLEAGLDFWRRQLAGATAFELPADRPRPALLSHRGAHVETVLDAGLARDLRRLARRRGATPFITLLAAFAALCHRLGGRRDLVLGTPISGRGRPEIEGLIGLFINNLVLRFEVEGRPSFGHWLASVRDVALEAYAHQEVPFERLVDALGAARDLSRTPLFQVLFVGQNAPLEARTVGGLEMVPEELDAGTARFDLAVAVAPVEGAFRLTFKYARDLFDRTSVLRLARSFEGLLRSAVADPSRFLDELPVLRSSQEHQLTAEWNDTARRGFYPGDLHRLMAAAADASPASPPTSPSGRRRRRCSAWNPRAQRR
jgi:acyl carrier protein